MIYGWDLIFARPHATKMTSKRIGAKEVWSERLQE